MSKAFKCDRCLSLFEPRSPLAQSGEVYETAGTNPSFFRIRYQLSFRSNTTQAYGVESEPDLCAKCRVEILEAVKAKLAI